MLILNWQCEHHLKCEKRCGQGYEVVDTVGLGEDNNDGEILKVKQLIMNWLKSIATSSM